MDSNQPYTYVTASGGGYSWSYETDLISRVTDAVVDELAEWQSRPKDAVYLYTLIVIEHGACRVHLVGITAHRDGAWERRRHVSSDWTWGSADSVKFLIRDRAGQFAGAFDAVFAAEGVRILVSPPQAPRANAICERIIGTLRQEVLDWLLIVNERRLCQVLNEYMRHYTAARPHRALGPLSPAQAGSRPPEPINFAEQRIRRKQVLGGLTREYHAA